MPFITRSLISRDRRPRDEGRAGDVSLFAGVGNRQLRRLDGNDCFAELAQDESELARRHPRLTLTLLICHRDAIKVTVTF
jgi:hypothetical protein